ncbi:type I toxin-antitoxin system SymE family toxin [Pseudomonas sp. R2.Fl]|nr:type I toxin-antitoxin system SymE family toxin [Pseudomonas sp. R2.Fl]
MAGNKTRRPYPRERQLKTGYAYYPHTGKGRPTPPFPSLRLQGRWLEQAGFSIGQTIQVRIRAGRLVLEPVKSD